MRTEAAPFTILTVCTGNICRSPLAEALLQDSLAPLADTVKMRSAGTRALVGGNVPPEIHAQAELWGLSLDSHTPTQLDEHGIAAATLVLTAERSHRAEVVSMMPAASRKVFTLKQFARVTESLSGEIDSNALAELSQQPFDALIEELTDHRALTPPPAHPEEDDIADPYLRSQRDYDTSAEEIFAAVQTIRRFFDTLGAHA